MTCRQWLPLMHALTKSEPFPIVIAAQTEAQHYRVSLVLNRKQETGAASGTRQRQPTPPE